MLLMMTRRTLLMNRVASDWKMNEDGEDYDEDKCDSQRDESTWYMEDDDDDGDDADYNNDNDDDDDDDKLTNDQPTDEKTDRDNNDERN